MRTFRPKQLTNKSTILIIGSSLIALVLIIKLFQLQVLAHSYYQEIATREQYGVIELPAQRGDVLIKDYHSDEEFLLATNTTMNLLYADPGIVKDPLFIGEQLHPFIFDLEDERLKEEQRLEELREELPADLTEEELNELLRSKSDEELETAFKKDLIEKISETQRQQILLAQDLPRSTVAQIMSKGIPGIEAFDNDIYAYPPQIANPLLAAESLTTALEIPTKKLETILKGSNRYVVLKKKIDPITTDDIKTVIEADTEESFIGIGFQEEYARYYPEGTLGANIIGYVDKNNIGQYGIESSFNTQLKGVGGKFQTKRDSLNRQITVGESILDPAVDGDEIVLTIDRSVQLKIERILASAVKRFRANSGQIIVMNPQTGAIIAMAHAPSFDPNHFGDVFNKEEIEFTPEEMKNLNPTKTEGVYQYFANPRILDSITIFEEKDDKGNSKLYKYVNTYGPEVYHNKIVSWSYEPGSIFKSMAMAMAIDDGDVTPNTKFLDNGPIEVDWNVFSEKFDFKIKNSEDEYKGWVDMTTVLAESLNTGMTFVAQQLGRPLFYSYLDKFGFLDRTDIEFDNESTSNIKYWEDWKADSDFYTKSFGQGMTVNMVQMANGYSVLANGGVLMQPYIIDEVRHDDGRVTETDPHEIRRVISEEASDIMTAMLTHSTEYGVAQNGQVDGHYVAGKTGTSQTYKWGQAISGKGTTITGFAGFGPADDPQFVILVKFDRPKENEWGSQTAAPVFSEVASYLFEYYNIPPDKY